MLGLCAPKMCVGMIDVDKQHASSLRLQFVVQEALNAPVSIEESGNGPVNV